MKTRYFCKGCHIILENYNCPYCKSYSDIILETLYNVTVPSFTMPVWGEDRIDAQSQAYGMVIGWMPDFETEEA